MTASGDDGESKSEKRQSTLDESHFDVPEAKKLKTEPAIAGEVDDDAKPAEAAIEVKDQRKKDESQTSILEKGLIYFFFRPRVDMGKISSSTDAQRSYIVLRPLPQGAKLEDDSKAEDIPAHFLELPKKDLPQKGDQFMAFVAQGKANTEDIRNRLASNTYSTKTRGERTTPAGRPMGEGVYCIANVQDTTHLAYILSTPTEMGEVQDAFGLHHQGSFIISVKNPQSKSGGNQLPGNANFPEELQKEFGSRSWLPMKPQHLDYDDCGLLFIGQKEEAADKIDEEVHEALTKLEDEDSARESLKQIFIDLGLSLKEHESKPLIDGKFS